MPDLGFAWDTPAWDAVRGIAESLWAAARACEPGICSDSDPEYLHEYRVCLRKIRSLISQFGAIYERESFLRLREGFAELAHGTNTLRDLDVELAGRAGFLEILPPDLRAAGENWFCLLAEERAREQAVVAARLAGNEYHSMVDELSTRLSQAKSATGEGSQPAGLLFARALRERYKKLCKRARALRPTSSDQEIHRLRIQCKKLRYLLDFAAPLLGKAGVKRTARRLKNLQDGLGLITDCAVQRARLTARLASMEGSAPEVVPVVAAMKDILEDRQCRERDRISRLLKAMTSPRSRSDFQKIVRGLLNKPKKTRGTRRL